MLDNYHPEISIRKQCSLLDITRSSLYYKPIINNDSTSANLIHEIYLKSDCRYGYRKITQALHAIDYIINKKKVLKLMQEMQIQGIFPKKYINTSIKDNQHKIYPYLLSNLKITYPDQVWATDITYIRMNGFFMYFVAIIDLYSRYIVSYDLSHSLETWSAITSLKSALQKKVPLIFNSDQGVQFTSYDFITLLKSFGIKISMDHKGRCFDNIFIERFWRTLKQEAIYFYKPETITELEKCLVNFVNWYNNERLHQSLNYKTPREMYLN
jgi:putative transposase